MPSAKRIERLLRLEERAFEQAVRAEPKTGVHFSKLIPGREARLIYFWTAPREITDAQASKLYAVLAAGSIVDIKQNRKLHIRSSSGGKFPLLIALHKYARSTAGIKIPLFSELLKGYVFRTLSRLLEKYGWEAGESQSAAIRPLRQWAPEDSKYLIDMLDRLCIDPVTEAPLNDA